MYKGNILDFLEKLAVYMKDKYGLYFHHTYLNYSFPRAPDKSGARKTVSVRGFFIALMKFRGSGATLHEVFDREDLEQQIYDYINKMLRENNWDDDWEDEPEGDSEE